MVWIFLMLENEKKIATECGSEQLLDLISIKEEAVAELRE
jgi:hypothetical protein